MYILIERISRNARAARGLLLRKLVAAVYALSLSVLSLLSSSPIAAQGTILQINAGGPAVPPFQADQGFTLSNTTSHPNAIDTTKAINPAPAAVYDTGRIGNFTYTLGGFVPGSTALVRLHFAETYWTASGQRVFNVSVADRAPLATRTMMACSPPLSKNCSTA